LGVIYRNPGLVAFYFLYNRYEAVIIDIYVYDIALGRKIPFKISTFEDIDFPSF
jgi:hypothetical protein